MIDLYCERLAPGLLGEPLNALTNLAFIAAGWFVQREAGEDRDARVLGLMVIAIGIASLLFHTTASLWAQWLDALSILGFELTFLFFYTGRYCDLGLRHRIGLVLVFGLATLVTGSFFPAAMNGSLAYLPPAGALLIIGLHAKRCGDGHTILAAAGTAAAVPLVFPHGRPSGLQRAAGRHALSVAPV